jgi:hypothetical protein
MEEFPCPTHQHNKNSTSTQQKLNKKPDMTSALQKVDIKETGTLHQDYKKKTFLGTQTPANRDFRQLLADLAVANLYSLTGL